MALSAARVLVELNKHDDARVLLTKALKQNPDSVPLKRDLAWLLFGEERSSEAAPLFEQLGTDTEDLMLLLTRGMFEIDRKEFQAAEAIFEKITRLWPRLPIGHYFLGEIAEARGDLDKAVSSYERALKEDSHFVEVRPRLAALFEKQKKVNDAWRQYVRMSYADPGNNQAAMGMARLASQITQKPEEIVPPKVIAKHTVVPAVVSTETLSVMKVGIGCSQGGAPTSKKSVSFRVSDSFVILNSTKPTQEIFRGQPHELYHIRVSPHGGAVIITDAQGAELAKHVGSVRVHHTEPSGTMILNALTYAPGMTWGGMADKELRGPLEFVLDKKKKRLVIVNYVNIEEYALGVLAAEMPVHWPLEALKAQAVIVRTLGFYRKRNLRLHRKYGYDLCDEQHCQVYTGVSVESDKVRKAVEETRGLALTYWGDPLHAVFSSNCGGRTQTGGQAGWGDVAYWTSVSDARPGAAMPENIWELGEWLRALPELYCKSSTYVWMPEHRWWRIVPADVLTKRVARKRKIGRIRQVRILKRNKTGRVRKVEFVGTNGSLTLTKEHEIRRYLGLGLLRSDYFVLDRIVKNEKSNYFVIAGGGWGHGVGFCQSGAAGRAEDKQTFTEILKHYFSSAVVKEVQ